MERKPAGRAGGAAAAAIAVMILLLPVLYVAALGPLVWLHDRGWMSEGATNIAETVYSPLAAVSDQSSVTARPLEWYMSLWESGTPAPPPNMASSPQMTLPAPSAAPSPTYSPALP